MSGLITTWMIPDEHAKHVEGTTCVSVPGSHNRSLVKLVCENNPLAEGMNLSSDRNATQARQLSAPASTLFAADFTARGINGENVASGESTDLARLLHESGEWYGWASQAEVTKDSHPWLLEYDKVAAEYVNCMEKAFRKQCGSAAAISPVKRQKTENSWVMHKKKKLLNAMKKELEMYAKENMDFLNTSLEAFAAVAAAAERLYVWMEELLIDDPDCREELEDMYMAKEDMIDKMIHKVNEAIQVTRKEVLADMKRLGGA